MTSIIPIFMGIVLYYFISDVTQMVKAKSKDVFKQHLKISCAELIILLFLMSLFVHYQEGIL